MNKQQKITELLDQAEQLNKTENWDDEEAFMTNWHEIDRQRFRNECDDEDHYQERCLEEQMLGNWDWDNSHPY